MLTTTIRRTILRYSMAGPGDRVLVGLSAGADSVALTFALDALRADLGFELVIAHLNHTLRDDAGADEAFCQEFASRLDLAYVSASVDVASKATAEKRTLEDAGRAARYAFFLEQASLHHCNRVATGHTMDDQAETLVMRLARGSGLRGLTAMHPVHTRVPRTPEGRGEEGAINIIRPLIEVRRHEIESYLGDNALPFREDPSNQDRRFTRNRLRHDVLPHLTRELNPRLVETLARSADIIRGEDDFMEKQARLAFDRAVIPDSSGLRLSVPILDSAHPALRRRVARLALAHSRGAVTDISLQHVSALLGLLSGNQSGRETHLPGVVVERSFDELRFTLKSGRARHAAPENGYNSFEYRLAIPAKLPVRECQGLLTAHLAESIRTGDEPGAAAGNAVVVGVDNGISELRVRSPRPSDRFRPLGAPGSKPLARYLMERKVAKTQRRHVPLVVRADDQILWVAGHSVSETARLRAGRRRLYLEWMNQ